MSDKKKKKARAGAGSGEGQPSQPSTAMGAEFPPVAEPPATIGIGSPVAEDAHRTLKERAILPDLPEPGASATGEAATSGAQADAGVDTAAGPSGPQHPILPTGGPTVADSYFGAGSEATEGASRSLADVTVAELMAFAPSPARPDWMVTRFPVSMEEYRSLEMAARAADPMQALLPGEEAQVDPSGEQAAFAAVDIDFPEAGGMEPAGLMAAGPAPAAPGMTANFAGIPATGWQPPDNNIAVGPSHVLVAVNTDLAGYSKSGALSFRWPNMTTLFSPVLPSGAQIFDPQLAYDHYSGRYIVVAAARRASPAGSWLMVGVTQTGDPGGAYWVWALDASVNGSAATNNWADYPMVGFDTQGIYIACNMFQIGGGFVYSKLRILNKAELYAGGTGAGHSIRWYDLWGLRNPDSSLAFTVLPAKHFRGTGGNPPAYLVNALWPSGNKLTLWTLNNPVAFWSGGAPSLSSVSVSCRSYDLPPDAQQPGTTTRLETNDSRLMHAVFQYVGTTQRLWTCHASKYTWSGDSEARSVAQWYEIDVPSKTVVQQNAFGASGLYYFFPAIQTDLSRNAYLVFSRSGSGEFGQLRQTGRRASDAANSLQGSALIRAGASAYTGGRWGDYFGICRDGGDANQVWMYGEFANTGGAWGTQVAAARY
jgi:hypothetical protein